VRVHHGAARARGPALAALAAGADLLLTTYPVVARDADDLAGVGWYRVVCDEAQAVRNPATRQAAAVRALPARHRIAVTGTPVENRLADLWSIMDFANPGLLGDLATFRRRYADPVERHGDPHAAARLRRLTGPFLLRRRKDDPAVAPDLPARIDTPVACALTGEQADLYRAVLAEAMTRIDGADGMRRRGLVLATLTRLKQVCDHPELLVRGGGPLGGRSGKVTRIEEIVEQVRAAGEKVLLFTQYARFATLLRDHLVAVTGREVLLLHGRTPRAARDAAVRRFQAAAPGGPAVFVVSLRAGGTGLNLTAAAHVVHVDRWWNPAVEDQASDRAHRIGQTRAVRVHTLACAGTVEERVAEVVRAKRYLSAAAVASGERWLADLSTPQLRELFALDARAVIG
jgi:SNF2 family DNA or RNA helicase